MSISKDTVSLPPLREQVQIPQKTVRYRPIDKVLDGLLEILCGAKTIAQSNVTIRVDPAVQRAFGRTGCAEQSTIARTLRACTTEQVTQLERVSRYYLKRYGRTPRHRFDEKLLWIDVDVTPCPLMHRRRGANVPGWDAIATRSQPFFRRAFVCSFAGVCGWGICAKTWTAVTAALAGVWALGGHGTPRDGGTRGH